MELCISFLSGVRIKFPSMPHHSLSPQDAAEDSLVDREAKDLLKQMVVPLVQFIKHQQSSFAEQLQRKYVTFLFQFSIFILGCFNL